MIFNGTGARIPLAFVQLRLSGHTHRLPSRLTSRVLDGIGRASYLAVSA